ncbi:hypothetical protein Ancab_023394 [Ancistrocladus abbreviatus]
MGSGKHRWKFSIHRSSSTNNHKLQFKSPPSEFICPISGFLMADPVIVSSGQTFERACVQACKALAFTPSLKDGSSTDFSTVIPNLALKSTIFNWASQNLSPSQSHKPLDIHSALKVVGKLIEEEEKQKKKNKMKEIVISPTAVTDFTRYQTRFDSGESIPSSVPSTPLQLTSRPRCCSSTSSSSSEMEAETPRGCEEEEYVSKLRSPHVHEQEEAVIQLRKTTRSSVDSRVSLCTPRLLQALRSLIISRYGNIQVNSVAALVNLSLEKANKVKIVRAGVVPPLVEVLKEGFPEAQEHASGALFSLALHDDNKTAIGVLGALPPLIHMMRSQSESARHDSVLALYHLSLVQSNRTKLVKLGSVQILLDMVKSGRMTGRVLLILCNLAGCIEGRAAMLDAGAVECFVEMLRKGEFDSESTRESCVAALCVLSYGGLRFKGLACAAGADEVLRRIVEEETGSKRAREKAGRVLEVLEALDEEEEVDWEKVLELGLLSRTFSKPNQTAELLRKQEI